MYNNPHITLLQLRYHQHEIGISAGRHRLDRPRSRRWTARYVRRRKLTFPAKNAGAPAGSIPVRL